MTFAEAQEFMPALTLSAPPHGMRQNLPAD